jgi:hypothetical protein
MSILSWLKSVTADGDASEQISSKQMTFSAGEEEFHGLNMKDALDAHENWYHRLEDKITGKSDERLEVATVACDDKCKLGMWIYSQGKHNFGTLPEFGELKSVHADFHLTAGNVLNDVLNGEGAQARDGLKKVRHKSGGVQLALVRLYSKSRG